MIDRTTGEVVPVSDWNYKEGVVTVYGKAYHAYTVSFLACGNPVLVVIVSLVDNILRPEGISRFLFELF